MKQVISIVVVFIGLYGVTRGQYSPIQKYPCEDCGCWEKCFSRPSSPSMAVEYARLYQYINQIRAGRVLNGAQSSVLLADLSQPNYQSFLLQKNLMKLAAYGLNSGRHCNPTAIAGHLIWGSFWWFPVNAQCPTACEMSKIIDSLPYFGQSSINPLGISCFLANFVMNLDPYQCRFNHRRYAVAFSNSPQSYVNPWCNVFPVRSAVDISTSASGFQSASWLRQPISFSTSLMSASQNLINCISLTCCRRQVDYPFRTDELLSVRELSKQNETEENDEISRDGLIYFVDAKEPKEVKKVEGNLGEFLAEKEKEADNCAVIPVEDQENFEGCLKEQCQDPDYAKQCPENCERCPLA